MQRRLTTIVAADLVGYSRLMAADEEGTVNRFRAAKTEVIDPVVEAAGGRIIKTMGDGLLIEFPSPVDAARSCIALQDQLRRREAESANTERLVFRIGINLGDVIIDGDDILGDAVNIAARMEGLSLPGGICISRTVHDQVRGKVDRSLTSLGPQQVKNIPEPVEAWRVEFDGVVEASIPVRTAVRPSIAVMAFDNMSSDPDQEFLADGIVEDVITELSRFRSLHVIARNSTFSFKGSHKDVRDVAKELNTRYVVQGSVRRAGNRLRISAQLIEAETGGHIWSDRWDRDMADLFDLQDELTKAIVTSVAPELSAHERTVARRKPTDSLSAWELCQKGLAEFLTYEDKRMGEAANHYRAAIAADAHFALPHALLGRLYWHVVSTGRSSDRQADVQRGMAHAQKAIELDPKLELGRIYFAGHLLLLGRQKDARAEVEKAIALNSNQAEAWHLLANLNLFSTPTDLDEMQRSAEMALAINPNDALAWGFHFLRGAAIQLRDPENPTLEVLHTMERACRFPEAEFGVLLYAACLKVRFNQPGAARSYVQRAMQSHPGLTLQKWREAFPYPQFQRLFEAGKRDMEALAEFGFPLE